MRRTSRRTAAGLAAATLAAGLGVGIGVTVAPSGTETANAQGGAVTQADLKAANQRSIRAIKQGVSAWNALAKYLAPNGTLISLQTPRLSQQQGTGGGGLPTSTIQNSAITTSKLSDGVQNRLPKWITKVDNSVGTTSRASSPAYSVVRIAAGNYRADFGDTNVSQCSWNAVPSVDAGLPGGFEVRTALDVTDATRVIVRTYTSAGALVESGWQAQVFC